MSSAKNIIHRVPKKRKYIYMVCSTHNGLGRRDHIYDHLLTALVKYLALAAVDPFRHDYIELVREHRLGR